MDVLEKGISRAERDNDLIYHQDIPPFPSLPAIQGYDMVKSTVPAPLHNLKGLVAQDGVLFGDLLAWGAKVAVGE